MATIAPGVASAQTDGERAIALGKEGLELYSAQKWSECAVKFSTADALASSPVFRLYTARCLRGTGRLLEAREKLRAVAAETIAADAPAPWRQASVDSKAELAQLEQNIPTVVVSAGASGEGAVLEIDGKPATLGAPVELDPGLHKLVLRRGGVVEEKTVELASGQRNVAIELGGAKPGDAKPGGDSPGAGTELPPPPKPDASGGPGIVPGVVVLSIGGAAAIAGAVLGGLALAGYGTLERCRESASGMAVCPPDFDVNDPQGKLDRANTFADASTGLLIGGGVVAVTGLVLMLVLPGDEVKAAWIPGGFRF
jgi:hypothetical protein